MLSSLFQQRLPIVTSVLGFFLIIASFYKIDDITKLQISPYPIPIYPIFACGIILMLASIAIFVFTDSPLNFNFRSKIRSTKTGFEIDISHAKLTITFGRIEECEFRDSSCVIALPANEFFDDECMNDKKSSLGAYMRSTFPEHIRDIQKLVSKNLLREVPQEVEKELGFRQPSYGIGTCIYLDKPLSSDRRIILTSVSTKRAGQGLRSESSYIFKALKSIHQVMIDHRLSDLYIPLLGSGHGGVRKETALLYMIMALWEILCGPSGHHLRLVTIIVFQKDDKTPAEISRQAVRQILSLVEAIFLRIDLRKQ